MTMKASVRMTWKARIGLTLLCMAAWVLVPTMVELLMGAPKLRVSAETTYLTEPVTEEGVVDYTAGGNARYGKKISPERNAAMGLVDALGIDKLHWKTDAEWAGRWMGLDERILEEGEQWRLTAYVSDEGEDGDVKSVAAWQDMVTKAGGKPWKSDAEYPQVAAWLDRNEAALDHVVACMERERFALPVVMGGVLVAEPMFDMDLRESVTWPLAARAMRRLGAGDADGALGDAMGLCRLGAGVGSTPVMIPVLIGYSITARGYIVIREVAYTQRCSIEQLRQIRERWRACPSMATMADAVNIGDRLGVLHSLQETRYGNDPQYKGVRKLGVVVDINEVFMAQNRAYDRIADIARIEDWQKRFAAAAAYDRDIAEGKAFCGSDLLCLVNPWPGAKQRQVGRVVGRMFVRILTPSFDSAMRVEGVFEMDGRLTELALALAMHQKEQGSYPATLEELKPRYVDAVSEDLFAGQPLHYQRRGDGYLLYSVGKDGVDDHAEKDRWGGEKDQVVRCRQDEPAKGE